VQALKSVRAVIADGDRFYREGLSRLLQDRGIEVVREVSSGDAAVEAVQETAPDVLVISLNVSGLSGADATRRIKEHGPATGLLVLATPGQEGDMIEAIRAGASGYVMRDRSVDEIVVAVRVAAASPAGPPPPGD
jgi:DNA-binding NarL/FixJ family response regulator